MDKEGGLSLPQLQSKELGLEHQLEKIRSKQNASLAQINLLKEQVNVARRERVVFSNVFKKLENDIKQKDEQYKKVLIQSLQLENEKKSQEEKLANIKISAQIEEDTFEEEYDNYLVHANEEYFSNEVIPAYNPDENKAFAEQAKVENSEGLRDKAPMRMISQVESLASIQSQVQNYEYMFNKLEKEVGTEGIDNIVHTYNTIDQENQKLYNHVNEKEDEVRRLPHSSQPADHAPPGGDQGHRAAHQGD